MSSSGKKILAAATMIPAKICAVGALVGFLASPLEAQAQETKFSDLPAFRGLALGTTLPAFKKNPQITLSKGKKWTCTEPSLRRPSTNQDEAILSNIIKCTPEGHFIDIPGALYNGKAELIFAKLNGGLHQLSEIRLRLGYDNFDSMANLLQNRYGTPEIDRESQFPYQIHKWFLPAATVTLARYTFAGNNIDITYELNSYADLSFRVYRQKQREKAKQL